MDLSISDSGPSNTTSWRCCGNAYWNQSWHYFFRYQLHYNASREMLRNIAVVIIILSTMIAWLITLSILTCFSSTKRKMLIIQPEGRCLGGLYFSYVLKHFLLLFLWIQSCLVGADLQVFCPKRLKHIETRQKDWYGQDSHLDWNGIPKCPGLVYFGNGSPDTGLLRKSWTTAYLKI